VERGGAQGRPPRFPFPVSGPKPRTDGERPDAGSLYSSPEIYDVAFGWSLGLELDFLESCWSDHVQGRVRRILEPACGTGRVLHALAERGYQVLGYDLSPQMVRYASARLGPVGGRALPGDMTTFRAPGRFDAAFNLVNSIGYLLDDASFLAHLDRMADALRPGGVYVVQLNYAGEPPELSVFGPWGNRRGDLSTTLTWRVVREDVAARRSHQQCRITARCGSERRLIEEDHVLRCWIQEDFDRLVGRSRFRLAAVYHDRFDPFPLDEPRTGAYGNLYHVLVRG
jgi:SAM-dependent methyltransferase